MYNKEAQKKLDEAVAKIAKLRQTRENLAKSKPKGMSNERVQTMVDMLQQIESRANTLLDTAKTTTRRMIYATQKRDTKTSEKKQSRSLGSFIGELGKCAVNGVSTIANAAVPITTSVLKTSASLVDSVADAATSVAGTITKATADTASNILDSAQETSQALIGQTANFANAVTGKVTNTIGSLVGVGTEKATTTINTILGGGLSGTNLVSNLVSNTASTAQRILSGATDAASSIWNSTTGVATGTIGTALTGLTSLADTAVNGAGGMIQQASSLATNLIGGAATSIVDSIFGSGTSSGGTGGGLFGDAVSAATSAISSGATAGSAAVSAAGDLLGSMANGLTGLASGLLGGAADVAGGIADAGLSAVGGLLDTASSVGSSLLGAAGDLGGSLIDTASSIGGSLLDSVGSIANTAIDATGGIIDAAGGILDAGTDIIGGLAGLAGDVLDTAGDVIGTGLDLAGDVLDATAALAEDLVDTASDIADAVVDGVADVVDGLMNDTMDNVEDIVDDIEEEFEDIEEEAENMDDEFDQDNWDDDWLDDDYDPDADDEPGDIEDEEGDGEGEEDDVTEDWDDWDNMGGTEDPDEDEDEDDDPDADDEPDDIEDEDEDEDEDDDPDADDEPDDIEEEEENNNQVGETEEKKEEQKQNPASDSSTTTPMANDVPDNSGITPTEDVKKKIGWKSFKAEVPEKMEVMIHDGDQQLLNPYGPDNAYWTMYSFRPSDVEQGYPQIAITPASFEAIRSMTTMLNNIPWVVVKEYFFKNTASTMLDFLKKIMGMAADAYKNAKDDSKLSDENDASSLTAADVKKTGSSLLAAVKKKFGEISLKEAAIEIPYILYAGLRKKLFGNTYIFPYIVNSSTVINQASNASEWGNGEGGGGIMETFKRAVQGIANFVGGMAAGLTGSQAQAANLFPAPTWSNSSKDKVSFSFDLILINDNIVKTRNNYMCVNTIIHNNRSIQKAILAFPGALYEVWLPTGQRHLMCTGDFKLYPLGLNRKSPLNFFEGYSGSEGATGAWFPIGANLEHVATLQNPENKGHRSEVEVIPDAYKLSITFQSCLANNMNTAVFQYYVKMTGYDGKGVPEGEPGSSSKDDVYTVLGKITGKPIEAEDEPEGNNGTESNDNDTKNALGGRVSSRGVRPDDGSETALDAIDEELKELIETFDESTYNKRLEKFKPATGDVTINSDSAIGTVRKTQKVIRESNEFLSKLYNAPNNNLWYRPFEQEEIYTTLKPDYRQMLRKQYGDKLKEVRSVDKKLKSTQRKIVKLEKTLRGKLELSERMNLLQEKVKVSREKTYLKKQREELTDKIIQIDTDLIQAAFDEHDRAVSVKKNNVTFRIFKQVWNEKILNAYEKDKLQYMTSEEKTRYFNEKIRELKKYDNYGILNHKDWFFRVVVLDFIVSEMQRLVHWFKNCSWDAFDTVYKIIRKLRLLHLDIDSVRSEDDFDINRTNLFYLSEDDLKEFTKIDGMLTGNTLYQLFKNQVRISQTKHEKDGSSNVGGGKKKTEDKELIQEQESESEVERSRALRQTIVLRHWGSETELTKAAYDFVNSDDYCIDPPQEICGKTYDSIKSIKDRILTLKLIATRRPSEETELRELLGALTAQISFIKERFIMMKMDETGQLAYKEIKQKDDSINAQVMR